jgi:hypothetical protein
MLRIGKDAGTPDSAHAATAWYLSISPPRMSVRSIRSGSPVGSCTGPSGT